MKLYAKLSKIGFLKKNYAFKFLFIAFLGIHIPLLGVIFFVLFFKNSLSPDSILLAVLVFTLLAAFATLMILKNLIKPIITASKSLFAYRENRTISNLPLEYTDEAGLLMSNIQKTIEATENLLKDKQDLIFLLTHDMKNFALQPNALAQLIIEENTNQKINEYAAQILNSSVNQLNFIETFIELLKDEDQIAKEVIKVRKINMNEIFSIIQTSMQTRLDVKRINLKMESNVSEPILKINQTLLTRVLINLIDNAIKFSYPDSEIILKIKRDHAKLEISVTDNGIGFDNTKVKELFKKFTKMGRLGTDNEKSNGIGLYLCKQIILKSEGSLTAESKGKEQGAKFLINLRIYKYL